MKTAEEIAEEAFDDWCKFECDIIQSIAKAILADRAARDKRVIEVLEQIERIPKSLWHGDGYQGGDRYHQEMAKLASALAAELRKEEK